jgi:hypothetical protein
MWTVTTALLKGMSHDHTIRRLVVHYTTKPLAPDTLLKDSGCFVLLNG